MTALIRNYSAVVIEVGGIKKAFGSMQAAVGEASIDGTYIIAGDPITIDPSNGTYVLWEQAMSKLRFQQVGLRIVGDGLLQVGFRTDLPTSLVTPDYTTLGTRKRWRFLTAPCKLAPFWLCEQIVPGHTTLANEVADNAGVPALWTTYAGTADSTIIDKVMLRNTGTAAVTIERLIAR